MKSTVTALFAAAFLAGPATAQSTITDTFTSYFAFGDSLTDDGKFFSSPATTGDAIPGFVYPPSLDGRFSNGEVYAEYLEQLFVDEGLSAGNLALGGATGGDGQTRPLGPLGTFSGQIGTFANALSEGIGLPTRIDFSTSTPRGPAPGDNPLVSVFFGANDIFQGLDIAEAADTVANGIRALAALPLQSFDDFVVLYLPDIGTTPAFAFDEDAAALATAAANAFNALLAENVKDLRAEGLTIFELESQTAFDLLLADIASGGTEYGVLDSMFPCTESLTTPGPACDNPAQRLFADGVHPNGTAHEVLAGLLIDDLEIAIAPVPAPVPLPATLPLLLAALGGAGIVARRRAV